MLNGSATNILSGCFQLISMYLGLLKTKKHPEHQVIMQNVNFKI